MQSVHRPALITMAQRPRPPLASAVVLQYRNKEQFRFVNMRVLLPIRFVHLHFRVSLFALDAFKMDARHPYFQEE